MNLSDLDKNPELMTDEEEIEYFDELFYEISHDSNEQIDQDDYEEDFQRYWALKTLKRSHFHFFFVFFGFLVLILAQLEISNSLGEYSIISFLLITGAIVLFSLSIIIHDGIFKHRNDLINYKKKKLMNMVLKNKKKAAAH